MMLINELMNTEVINLCAVCMHANDGGCLLQY